MNDDDQYLLPVPPADAPYTVKSDGSRLQKLFGRYWGTGSEPDWSPDDSGIAFGARAHIFTLRANGRGLRRLTKRYSTPGNSEPAWSPDGRYIAFIRDHDLYVMRTNGRGLRRLIDVPEETRTIPRASGRSSALRPGSPSAKAQRCRHARRYRANGNP